MAEIERADTTGWDVTRPLVASGEAGVLVLRVTGSVGAVFSHTPTNTPDPLVGEPACELLGGRPCAEDVVSTDRAVAVHAAWRADPAQGMDALVELYIDIYGCIPLVTRIEDARYIPGGELDDAIAPDDYPPAGAVAAVDGEGDRWVHVVGATLQHTGSRRTASIAEVVRDYGPIRWYDADGREVLGGEA